MTQQDQPKVDVQLQITSLSFDFTTGGINAKVDFDSSHPDMTGTHVERLFSEGETVHDILQYHISDFPKWIDETVEDKPAILLN